MLTPAAGQSNNYHIFCFYCQDKVERDELLAHLQKAGVLALFHYLPLHRSPYILSHEAEADACPWADRYADCTVRLPLFAELKEEDAARITQLILQFYVLHPGGYALS
jgi:dTDP-4-amino-4,6-dideoxygalactose transaminase